MYRSVNWNLLHVRRVKSEATPAFNGGQLCVQLDQSKHQTLPRGIKQNPLLRREVLAESRPLQPARPEINNDAGSLWPRIRFRCDRR